MKQKKLLLLIIFLLVIQSCIFIILGSQKEYIHMDEAYSLGLTHYDKVEIQDNSDFYDTWHSKEYYEEYLSLKESEVNNYQQVYENQKNDVHPPLYYLFLKFMMQFSLSHFSKWPGIILNIIIYVFVTIFLYFILKKLLKGIQNSSLKAIFVAFFSSITLASLTNVIYIRMYSLVTLFILITLFLHIKLSESKKTSLSLYFFLFLIAQMGSLTHYYYLFFLAMLYVLFMIKYIKEKNYTSLLLYNGSLILAALASLWIFPYSVQHMFFGYRGQGALNNLFDIRQFFIPFIVYIWKVNLYVFNGLLFLIILFIMYLNKKKKQKGSSIFNKNKEVFKIILIPTLFYFVLVGIVSPWMTLRYILPICGLIFILVFFYLYSKIKDIYSEKKSNCIVLVILFMLLLAPFIFRLEPEELYRDKKGIVTQLEGEYNLPTIYFLNVEQNRFLDDILLFSKLDDSFVTKNMNFTEKDIQNILKGKDITKGIIIFINEGINHETLLEFMKESTNLKTSRHLKRLNACDVYYLG